MNMLICTANTQNLKDVECQVYSNYQCLTLSEIHNILGKECVLAPEIGNFPHMSGTNNPVKITSISSTRNDDNAGMDIKEVISRYNDWGHNPT